MKKLSICFTALLLALLLTACGDGHALSGDVDFDLTSLDSYNTILAFQTDPSSYEGKTVAVCATNSVIYSFSENTVTPIMLGYDPAGCCNAYYFIRTEDGRYPKNGAETVFEGCFADDGYIDITGYKSNGTDPEKVDIDTLDLSAAELEVFVLNFRELYAESKDYGKTVRIFGHLEEQSGYYYLSGITAEGQPTWSIEVYDPTGTVTYPLEAPYVLNPVEIVGELSTYVENNITYACIRVISLTRVEGVLS